MKKIRIMIYTALLTALAIIIPVVFGNFLRIYIPPFSATLAAHVPMMLSMFLGPVPAVMVGIGSTLGFFMTTPAVIAARASTHIVVGLAGALLIKKGVSLPKTVILTSPIHAVLEALVVIPFIGFSLNKVLIVVGVGTLLHHMADGFIASVLVGSLEKSLKIDFRNLAVEN
jgi:niacin transporter